MDADGFRAARRALGLTEIEFAAHFGVSRRTVQNWSSKGPPGYIGELLQLAVVMKIASPSEPDTSALDIVSSDEADRKLAPALNAFGSAAYGAGWSKDQVIQAIRRWLERH